MYWIRARHLTLHSRPRTAWHWRAARTAACGSGCDYFFTATCASAPTTVDTILFHVAIMSWLTSRCSFTLTATLAQKAPIAQAQSTAVRAAARQRLSGAADATLGQITTRPNSKPRIPEHFAVRIMTPPTSAHSPTRAGTAAKAAAYSSLPGWPEPLADMTTPAPGAPSGLHLATPALHDTYARSRPFAHLTGSLLRETRLRSMRPHARLLICCCHRGHGPDMPILLLRPQYHIP